MADAIACIVAAVMLQSGGYGAARLLPSELNEPRSPDVCLSGGDDLKRWVRPFLLALARPPHVALTLLSPLLALAPLTLEKGGCVVDDWFSRLCFALCTMMLVCRPSLSVNLVWMWLQQLFCKVLWLRRFFRTCEEVLLRALPLSELHMLVGMINWDNRWPRMTTSQSIPLPCLPNAGY